MMRTPQIMRLLAVLAILAIAVINCDDTVGVNNAKVDGSVEQGNSGFRFLQVCCPGVPSNPEGAPCGIGYPCECGEGLECVNYTCIYC
jgi:hypothetical protein